MNRTFTSVAVAATMFMGMAAHAADSTDMDALKAEAGKAVMALGGPLKKALEDGMANGGPGNAIGVCNTKAPELAHAATTATGWTVGRTSLKIRNPGNEPDAWELATLKEFESRKAAGENPDAITKAEVVEDNGQKVFRFMKAIPTGDVCLNCHGTDLTPEVSEKLNGLYPDDKARGFMKGDLRGAFTVKKAL